MKARGIVARLVGTALVAVLATAGPPPAAARCAAGHAVWHDGDWHTWWRADAAPAVWAEPSPILAGALHWEVVTTGVEWATLRLSCAMPGWRLKVIVARLDPRQVDLTLQFETHEGRPNWTLDRAPDDAVLAVNAGQFVGAMPWGWVVRDGTQLLTPGPGPLTSAIAIDRAGRVLWAHGDSLPSAAGASIAFQSYPTLLARGAVPLPLREPGLGVSHTHRDARLAIGETADHRLLIVLTRFDGMGDITGALPLGPTTPEMAAILGALGARDAVMLDGGISAQLLLRGTGWKVPERWPGMRKVPLALIARERHAEASR